MGRRERQARKASPLRKPGDLLEPYTDLSDRERKVIIVNPDLIFVRTRVRFWLLSMGSRRAFLCSTRRKGLTPFEAGRSKAKNIYQPQPG
jgi:hypothetical protein